MTTKTTQKKARARLHAMMEDFTNVVCKPPSGSIEEQYLRAAIRAGLGARGTVHGRESTALDGAMHSINLARINLCGVDADGRVQHELQDLADVRDPESALVALATAAADLEELMDAVAAEIEAVRPLLARKAARKAA